MPNSRSNKMARIEAITPVGGEISPAREEMQKKMEEDAKDEGRGKDNKGGMLSGIMGMLGK